MTDPKTLWWFPLANNTASPITEAEFLNAERSQKEHNGEYDIQDSDHDAWGVSEKEVFQLLLPQYAFKIGCYGASGKNPIQDFCTKQSSSYIDQLALLFRVIGNYDITTLNAWNGQDDTGNTYFGNGLLFLCWRDHVPIDSYFKLEKQEKLIGRFMKECQALAEKIQLIAPLRDKIMLTFGTRNGFGMALTNGQSRAELRQLLNCNKDDPEDLLIIG